MEFLTGKHLDRRTFVKGMGTSVALPLLDAMVPAGRGWRNPTDETQFTRFVAVEESMGASCRLSVAKRLASSACA